MKITIKASAHYANGRIEHFSRMAEVTEEELTLIKQCAENNNEELDALEEQSEGLYDRLYSICRREADERAHAVDSYRPVRILGSSGTVYRRRPTHVSSITMYYKEHNS